MKIDLHCHTKATKKGENSSRNVTPTKFVDVLKNNGIKIVAITNHNFFDTKYYLSFSRVAEDSGINVWPGVELDCSCDDENGHIIVIGNPKEITSFSKTISSILADDNPNDFIRPIIDILASLSDIDCIIIAHSSMKSHGFSDKTCTKIKNIIGDSKIILFEPSNIKSVGIMFANDIYGFVGSDVQDWDNYPSNKVPELKMDISSFEAFKLLLKKDGKAIKTFLDQKKLLPTIIKPFEDEGDFTPLSLNLIHDINVVYGGKGTGKTKIITAYMKYFSEKLGASAVSYYGGRESEAEFKKLVKKDIDKKDFLRFEIQSGEEDIASIREWKDASVIPTEKFYKGFETIQSSKNSSVFGFSRSSYAEINTDTEWKKEQTNYTKIRKSISCLVKINASDYLTKKESESLMSLLFLLQAKAKQMFENKFLLYKALKLEEWTINTMKEIALTKTGKHSLPSGTGLLDVFTNSLNLYKASNVLTSCIDKNHVHYDTLIGYLEDNSQYVLSVDLFLNPDEETKIVYGNKKLLSKELKKIKKALLSIKNNCFSSNVSTYIEDFNESSKAGFTSLYDFLGIKTKEGIFRNGRFEIHSASSGEKSMLLLTNALIDSSKEVFVLDEPELSVGHKYVNDVIVPRLKELSKMDKIVILSTHDANIAVRTIPLVSIYREFKETYVGNLFTDKLVNEKGNVKSWIETSLDYLEGGKIAYKERGQSYGD